MTAVAERTTATGPTVGSVARRGRAPVLAVLVLVTVAAVAALVSAAGPSGRLDPDSPGPDGSKALAQVLRLQGVDVRRLETVEQVVEAGGPRDTLVLAVPQALAAVELQQLGALSSALVVVGADDAQLEALGLAAETSGETPARAVRPQCGLELATRAGEVDLGGLTYRATAGPSTGCYAVGGEPTLLRLPERRVTLLGDGGPLTNDGLDEEGNASLALGLLSERGGDVLWLVPRPGRAVPSGDQPSLSELLPDGLLLGALQLLLAVAVLALWRARRLGRVVEEPLPVVVRAAEAIEGRSRLYRAARAHDSAAAALRTAARERLSRASGLGPGAGRDSLVPLVAAAAGQPPAVVDALLYGGPPADDAALVRLVQDLRSLESAVTSTGSPASPPPTRTPNREVAGP